MILSRAPLFGQRVITPSGNAWIYMKDDVLMITFDAVLKINMFNKTNTLKLNDYLKLKNASYKSLKPVFFMHDMLIEPMTINEAQAQYLGLLAGSSIIPINLILTLASNGVAHNMIDCKVLGTGNTRAAVATSSNNIAVRIENDFNIIYYVQKAENRCPGINKALWALWVLNFRPF